MNKNALIAFLTLAATPAAWADTYTIDPNHTLPVFEVNHLGFSTQRGRFDQTSGKIQGAVPSMSEVLGDLLLDQGSLDSAQQGLGFGQGKPHRFDHHVSPFDMSDLVDRLAVLGFDDHL